MTSLRAVASGGVLPRHADEAAYIALIEKGSDDLRYRDVRISHRQRFVEAYPDLERWLSEPLAIRVGRLVHERRESPTSRVNYEARTYLIFLGLTGQLCIDYDWLLALPNIGIWEQASALGMTTLLNAEIELTQRADRLGYYVPSARKAIRWVLGRLALHTGEHQLAQLGSESLEELEQNIDAHSKRLDLAALHGSTVLYARRRIMWRSNLHHVRVLLYHLGYLDDEPRVVQPLSAARPPLPPGMQATVERYLDARHLTCRVTTMANIEAGLRRFTTWLRAERPDVHTFADIDRDTVLEFVASLSETKSPRTGRPLALCSRRSHIQAVSGFFRHGAAWEWDGMPARPLLGLGDLPRIPQAIPRYIPRDELDLLTAAIRDLACPYQRAALLVARWCGARRGEIRRLGWDCLDAYPDGTPRLRIPAGKTYRERMVPLNIEAAEAVEDVIALRSAGTERPFTDSHTATATRYLFIRHGKLMSLTYLFDDALRRACVAAGLVTKDGKPTVSSHRFRHTVGTQLAERGAKLHTIMSVLGHRSVGMSLVYAQISDREVLRDYQSVLGPDARLAGPYATTIRGGSLSEAAVEWLKTNFLKTELELGRCLRLPQEGPCECDLALACAKFVTTPAYAPRLRARRAVELGLVADADERGWGREQERHQAVVDRIDLLLTELDEPFIIPGEDQTFCVQR